MFRHCLVLSVRMVVPRRARTWAEQRPTAYPVANLSQLMTGKLYQSSKPAEYSAIAVQSLATIYANRSRGSQRYKSLDHYLTKMFGPVVWGPVRGSEVIAQDEEVKGRQW
jgi:hypothetical protein